MSSLPLHTTIPQAPGRSSELGGKTGSDPSSETGVTSQAWGVEAPLCDHLPTNVVLNYDFSLQLH